MTLQGLTEGALSSLSCSFILFIHAIDHAFNIDQDIQVQEQILEGTVLSDHNEGVLLPAWYFCPNSLESLTRTCLRYRKPVQRKV